MNDIDNFQRHMQITKKALLAYQVPDSDEKDDTYTMKNSISRASKPETLEVLREIAKNPGDAARMYGQKTGICCCGAELTNAQSIAAGIGPICAGNWGL